MANVIGGDAVILYGLDSNGVPVPLKLNADGTLSAAASSGLELGSTPSTQAFGDAAAAGASVKAAPELHKHGMPSFATPALTLGIANAGGAATTPIRSDATILAFDATNPAATGAAAPGVATVAARRDHVHALSAHAASHQIGGSDTPLGITKTVVKASIESLASNINLQDDDELLMAVAANETWVGRFVLFVDGATAGDIKAAVAAPAGASGRYAVLSTGTTGTAFENTTFNNQGTTISGTGLPAGTLGAGNTTAVLVEFICINGATPGSIKLQWAQNTSSVTNTRVLDGSFLTAWRVA